VAEWYGLAQPYGFGLGFQSPITGVKPAAGANFSLAIDARWRWRIVTAVFTLVTDANAANRYVTLEYQDGSGVALVVDAAAVVVTANSTQRFAGSTARGVAEWAANTDVLFPLTPVFLDGGGALTINVANKQVTDQLSAIRFLVDRFPTDLENYPGAES
jgi:hypothetical protein